MNYWIFIVTQKKTESGLVAAESILKQRLVDRFWGLGERTPYRRALRKGDRVVFYVGAPMVIFAATAVLETDGFELNAKQKDQYSHGKELFRVDYGVILENIQVWDPPRLVKELMPFLTFIKNKQIWSAYFQSGVHIISEEDFQAIVDNRGLSKLTSMSL